MHAEDKEGGNMRTYFTFSLEGKDWIKPFVVYWILTLILNGVQHPGRWAEEVPTGWSGGASVIFSIILVIVSAIYTIKFCRIIVPKLSIGEKRFGFGGEEEEFVRINIVGMLLSIITLSIYVPWFIRKVIAYLASETTFDSEHPQFNGKAKTLLKYFILAFLLPLIVIAVLFGISLGVGTLFTGTEEPEYIVPFLSFIAMIVLIPFFYLAYK